MIIYVNSINELKQKISLYRKLYDYNGKLGITMVRGIIVTKASDEKGEELEVRNKAILYHKIDDNASFYIESITPENKIVGLMEECDVEFTMVEDRFEIY